MVRKVLTDARWKKIEHLLPGKASDPGRTARDNRLFVEAVLWIARTGRRFVNRDFTSAGVTLLLLVTSFIFRGISHSLSASYRRNAHRKISVG